MKGVKLEYKTEIKALAEYEGFFNNSNGAKQMFTRHVVDRDYVYSSFITMFTHDTFEGNKLVYHDMIRILKEVNIDGKYYILGINVYVLDGKLISSNAMLIPADLTSLDINYKVEEKLYKALDIFFSKVVNIRRATVDGEMHIEDYTYFFKSLDTITFISTGTEFFQG